MRKVITAIFVAFGLLVGGLVATAPAQAIGGTVIHYTAYEPWPGHPQPWIRVTKTSGAQQGLTVGNKARDVFRICPPSISYRFRYELPGSNVKRLLGAGACYTPLRSGEYDVELRLVG